MESEIYKINTHPEVFIKNRLELMKYDIEMGWISGAYTIKIDYTIAGVILIHTFYKYLKYIETKKRFESILGKRGIFI